MRYLKTHPGRYLQALGSSSGWDVKQQSHIGSYEQFDVIPQQNGKVALKTHHNRYLQGKSGSSNWDVRQQPRIGSYEQFTPISQNFDTDTLDFTETTTQDITIDLSSYDAQTVNSNLTLRLDSALGIDLENVTGGQKNDRITGNHLNNYLNGEDGNDTLYGGEGSNQLDGGSGEDTFVISNKANNTIHDFDRGENDKIDLTEGKFHKVVFNTENSDTIIKAKDSANAALKTIATVNNTQIDGVVDNQDIILFLQIL